jgi:hypothetical protein
VTDYAQITRDIYNPEFLDPLANQTTLDQSFIDQKVAHFLMLTEQHKQKVWGKAQKEQTMGYDNCPIGLKITNITRDGYVTIAFNQELMIPTFIDDAISAASRRLIALSDIDVYRDIMDFKFVLKSDIDPEEIKFNLILDDWTDKDMRIKINFTDPLDVSRGLSLDSMIIKIKNPDLFVSMITGETLEVNKTVMTEEFPRQLPPGVSEASLMREIRPSVLTF